MIIPIFPLNLPARGPASCRAPNVGTMSSIATICMIIKRIGSSAETMSPVTRAHRVQSPLLPSMWVDHDLRRAGAQRSPVRRLSFQGAEGLVAYFLSGAVNDISSFLQTVSLCVGGPGQRRRVSGRHQRASNGGVRRAAQPRIGR